MSVVEKFKNALTKLLPIGYAWEKIKSHSLFDGIAVEFSRVYGRIRDLLIREMDITKTDELLTDYETMVGIPDECTDINTMSQVERRAAVLERLSRVGSLSKEFYERIGDVIGFDITVEDANPFLTGYSRVGDALHNSDRIRDVFTVGDHTVGQQLRVYGWRYYFIVTVPISESSFFRVGENAVGDPLRTFGNQVVQCTIRKLKPAHTGVIFRFVE